MADIGRASAFMALGTIVSRITGFLRMMLLMWAIGTSLNADIFSTANTVPNALYILVAGGVFNVVLVPQLVRAMKTHPDGGDAYAQRVVTLGLLVLGVATIVLLAIVPWLLRLVFDGAILTSTYAEQRADAEFLLYLCLPQVFFYGAFVLVGQILNARERFGPMMWAPIVNNVIASVLLVAYVLLFGTRDGADGFSTNEALLLGIGSTLGIVAQCAVLVPYLRRAGFRYRPRFDFRATADNGGGLGHTLSLGVWTLGFILVNQAAFVVVNRLATSSNLSGDGSSGSGAAVYQFGFLISQVPHGVITVSLATAVMPTLAAAAADRHFDSMRADLMRTMRLALVVVVPVAAAVACLGLPLGAALSVGAASGKADVLGWAVTAFALVMVTFSLHYITLRGFYADEDTRTPFVLQCVVAASNVTIATLFVHHVPADQVAAWLALALGLAYAVGALLSGTVLSRRIGSLVDRQVASFVLRLVLATSAAVVVMLLVVGIMGLMWHDTGDPLAGLATFAVAGPAGALTYLLSAKVLGLREVAYLFTSFTRRGR